ncbi:di-heme oxidoredictase family protein [Rhodopirellula sallentina]|uniref:di-heme oxidoredictase family protein n=1 Tax=Rhodopirellula sallentina TaxID=1263869 RepID=UPI00034B1FFF|nr:di-heme oxidoredictase family protein [Rhodopirellula sallentina]
MFPADGFPADGLGPLYNAVSCAACHPSGGASGVEHNVTTLTIDPRSPLLNDPAGRGDRGAALGSVLDLFPGLVSANTLDLHTVVHDHSTRPGYDAIRQRLEFGVTEGIAPEWFSPKERTAEALAKRPVIAGRSASIDYYLSQRNTPPLYGMGDIEKISAGQLRTLALTQSRASGGRVTGRVAGKYGWRGQVETLAGFVVGACATELGLNVGEVARQAADPADPRYRSLAPDISPTQVADLTRYVAELPAPPKQVLSSEERKRVRRGEIIFNAVGCSVCHVRDLRPASGIYSDLLLHDMGKELQDPLPAPMLELTGFQSAEPTSAYQHQYGRGSASSYGSGRRSKRGNSRSNGGRPGPKEMGPNELGRNELGRNELGTMVSTVMPAAVALDYPDQPQFPWGSVTHADLQGKARNSWDALQREWKTPPLWGVADSAPYLHDGRAKTLTDAIEWHGGEAAHAKRKFVNLSDGQTELLLEFLNSLKAPSE